MEPLESAERRGAVGQLLHALGFTNATVSEWWFRPNADFDGLSPDAAWSAGRHLEVESTVVSAWEAAEQIDARSRAVIRRFATAAA